MVKRKLNEVFYSKILKRAIKVDNSPVCSWCEYNLISGMDIIYNGVYIDACSNPLIESERGICEDLDKTFSFIFRKAKISLFLDNYMKYNVLCLQS